VHTYCLQPGWWHSGVSKILVRVKSHRIQQIFSFINRQLLDSSHNVLLCIGRRHIFLLILLFFISLFFNHRCDVNHSYPWFKVVAFLPSFAFAFTLGPLFAIFIQVAIFLAIEAFSFLDEFQAFFMSLLRQ
jgi:hypothetical protein